MTLERFQRHDEMDCGFRTPCWVHRSSPNLGGYSQMSLDGVKYNAHRPYYEYYVGPIPETLTIDHLCRNRRCVNPAHLEPVTMAENTRRAGAAKTHCPHGHAYDSENTRVRRGARECRACNRDRLRAMRGNPVRQGAFIPMGTLVFSERPGWPREGKPAAKGRVVRVLEQHEDRITWRGHGKFLYWGSPFTGDAA